MSDNKAFKAFDWGTGEIDLRHHRGIIPLRPIEIHHKADGTLTGEPSFCIVMTDLISGTAFGEISLAMLNEGLADLGYEIVKKS